jgi:hypothetical protein
MWRMLIALVLAGSCKPQNVAEAEAKGDVKWLAENGSPEAVSALGRLADKDPKAASWLEAHATTDSAVYIAAWEATERNAGWGPSLLRSALLDTARADAAASAMKRGSPTLVQFIADLEGAVGRVEGTRPSTVAAVLASVGAPASTVIERRLADPKTRGAMCRGIGSTDSSAESRAVLLRVSTEARNDAGCLEAVTNLALVDPKVFDWLASSGETGLLRHVGEANGMPCAKLAALWRTAIDKRPASDHGALAIPLGAAIKRCPPEMDAVLAQSLDNPASAPLVIAGVDPYDRSTSELRATCSGLRRASLYGKIPRRSAERAQDAVLHGCPR